MGRPDTGIGSFSRRLVPHAGLESNINCCLLAWHGSIWTLQGEADDTRGMNKSAGRIGLAPTGYRDYENDGA